MCKRPIFLVLLVISIVLSSCVPKKKVIYFQDVGDFETIVNKNNFIPKFKVDDLVSIFISTEDEEVSKPFNLYRGGQENGRGGAPVDYLIDKDGNIDFPLLGKLKIAGLSPDEVRTLLQKKLDYLKDPIINIRLKNFTVTMLGFVNRKGTYNVNGERINIMEAIGMAGGLDIKGRRDNIMVMRDFNGAKVYHRIDITSKKVTESPAFYLTQNDIVYVEPNSSAVSSSSMDNRASMYLSIASLIITSSIILIRN